MAKMVNNTFAVQKHSFVNRYANVVFTTFHPQDLLIVDHHLKENGVLTRRKCSDLQQLFFSYSKCR